MGRPKATAGSPTKKKKRARNPNHPKRSITAYFYYLSSFREERKKKGLSIKPGDIAKEAGVNWNSVLTAEQKAPFLKSAAEDRQRYENEMAVFESKYKKPKDPNKPKKPATAFFLFLADFREEMKSKKTSLAHKDINSKAGEEWRGMTDEDKKKYVIENGKLRKDYEAAMAKYNAEGGANKKNGAGDAAGEDEDMNDEEDEEDEEDDDDDE